MNNAPSDKAAASNSETRRDYDNLFRDLTWKSDALPTALEAASIDSHLATEFSETSRRADYCARLTDGSILHVEFQSAREPDLVWRMVNYRRLIRTKIDPSCRLRQVVLFVGDEPPPSGGIRLFDGQLTYEGEARDIRAFAARHFLDSPEFYDNLLALLCHDGNTPAVLHRLRIKFESLPEDRREDALRKLLLVGALRRMDQEVFGEFTMSMAILKQDPFFGKLFDEVKAEGEAEGKAKGWRAGVVEARVADLTGIFAARGWAVTDLVMEATREGDPDILREMVTAAATARSIEEFQDRFGRKDRSDFGG